MSDQPTKANQLAILKRLDKFSEFTDSSIKIPLTNIRIGADAIVGLLPVVGDVAGLAMSAYVLQQAHQAGADRRLRLKMLRNVGIDFVLGLVPLVGDVFDVAYKANTRNTQLLRHYLEEQLREEKPSSTAFSGKTALIILLVVLACILGGLMIAKQGQQHLGSEPSESRNEPSLGVLTY